MTEITPEMIDTVYERVRKGYFDPDDCRNFVIPSPGVCDVTVYIGDVIELAVKELRIKSQNQKIDLFAEPELKPKPAEKDVKQKILLRTWTYKS